MQPLSNSKLPLHHGIRPYKFKETKRDWYQRSVVSFACSPQQNLLWSISSHREICMEDIGLNKVQLAYSCVSTNIGAMKECPDDMNKFFESTDELSSISEMSAAYRRAERLGKNN
ncbi:Protein rigor mortis [Eumeta japonica]|uniref:Protein rigor mortis n=1 Tax=Eumeta variegata TaxID=151549 RepID=A0A4C1T5Q0_EUMVA|nr:Protein rigor mortis [Eumeta japonica]